MKVRQTEYYYEIQCPACGPHLIPHKGNVTWDFNEDFDKPTFSPSVRHKGTYGIQEVPWCCHYIITDGFINFCGDCTHELAGKSFELKDYK